MLHREDSQEQRLPPLALSSGSKPPYRLQLLRKQQAGQQSNDSPCTIDTTSSTGLDRFSPFLTPSLFPNCLPTIHFAVAGEIVEFIPLATKRLLKWKMSSITPNVIKNCIKRSWFTPAKSSDAWLGYWGKQMKAASYKVISDFQKVNHFPGTFQIGRKDYLWRNLSRMQHRHGRMEFSFFPQTFILPSDLTQLKQEFQTTKEKQKWIVKPPASARGIGVRVISKWNQVPMRRPAIVQRYLDRPFLINESKFDLRVYVYVSSYDPMRIYVFKDGLARFATCKYSMASRSLSNRFMHLTNYSVNKKNSAFTPNSDETVCQGHKWGLQALWRYLKGKGIDVDNLWESIKDVIIKTVISSESAVSSLMKAHVHNRWCCHELFGFDIMLDDQLKPWVLEVNISPSLHSNSTLDENIKGQMVRDILNMAGFRLPPATKPDETLRSHMKVSSKSSGLSTDERDKHVFYIQKHLDEPVQQSIVRTLTPDDARILMETEDEFSRRGEFERVFPTAKTRKYLKFFETPRYYNLLLDEWIRQHRHYSESGIERLVTYASKGVHLGPTTDAEHRWCKEDSCLITRRALSAPSGVFVKTKSSRCKSSELRRDTSGLPGIWSYESARESKSGNKDGSSQPTCILSSRTKSYLS
jgi:tubulin polyglutamylase TTLL4